MINENDHKLVFKSVDYGRHAEIALAFRKDAHKISYGDLSGFDEESIIQWFHHLVKDNAEGFRHVWRNGQIIAQLEYKSKIHDTRESGDPFYYSYINLFYLIPPLRNQGIGQLLHDYVIDQCRQQGSQEAYLRYIPGNTQAKAFYRKNGWWFSGEPDSRGQLMVLDLT